MSEQRQLHIQLPDELGEVVETIQIVGSGTDEGATTFFATIYSSDEAGYLSIIESSHVQSSLADAIKQGLIRAPIDWEEIRNNWAGEHMGIGVFDTLEEARLKLGALRSDPPTWLPFR